MTIAKVIARLPTLADVEAMRRGKPIAKGPTRLQRTIETKALTTIDEKAFKAAVWARDRGFCRVCSRKVQKVLARIPARGEVHHTHGRAGDLRFEVRAAILVCAACHERLTGRVNDKLSAVPSRTFTIRQGTFTDATFPITFTRTA
jgi:hypothetical protein